VAWVPAALQIAGGILGVASSAKSLLSSPPKPKDYGINQLSPQQQEQTWRNTNLFNQSTPYGDVKFEGNKLTMTVPQAVQDLIDKQRKVAGLSLDQALAQIGNLPSLPSLSSLPSLTTGIDMSQYPGMVSSIDLTSLPPLWGYTGQTQINRTPSATPGAVTTPPPQPLTSPSPALPSSPPTGLRATPATLRATPVTPLPEGTGTTPPKPDWWPDQIPWYPYFNNLPVMDRNFLPPNLVGNWRIP